MFLRSGQQPKVSCFLSYHVFILLRIFSPVKTISVKIWETLLSWHKKRSLPVAVCVSKRSVLKLVFEKRTAAGTEHFACQDIRCPS